MGSSNSKVEGYSLADFCSNGGKWSVGEVVHLDHGANEVDSDCLPCSIDHLTLICPDMMGEEGWTGLEVSHWVAWFLVFFLLSVILKMWSESSFFPDLVIFGDLMITLMIDVE